MCPNYEAFGISFDGGHAEFVKIPASAISQGNVMPLPDEVSFEEASLIAEHFQRESCTLQAIPYSQSFPRGFP